MPISNNIIRDLVKNVLKKPGCSLQNSLWVAIKEVHPLRNAPLRECSSAPKYTDTWVYASSNYTVNSYECAHLFSALITGETIIF